MDQIFFEVELYYGGLHFNLCGDASLMFVVHEGQKVLEKNSK